MALSSWVYAQDALEQEVEEYLKDIHLDEVIVTGERPYRTPLTYTAPRSIISPDEVRRSGQTTLIDLLRRAPSVHVNVETGTDSKPNIGARGLNPQRSSQVSLLVDGIPLAPAPYGHPGQSLFPFTFERVYAVDMYRGGYTVRYGPNTVAGVINFLTRPIPTEPTVEAVQRFGTHGESNHYVGLGGTFEELGIWLEGVHKSGDTRRANGDFTIQNYGAKLAYQPTETLSILLQLDYFQDESRLSGGLSQAAFDANPRQSITQEDFFDGDQIRGNLRLRWQLGEDRRVDLLVYAFGGDRTFFLGRPFQYGRTPTQLRATPRPMTTRAVQPEYWARLDLLGHENQILVGLRRQWEDIDSSRITTPFPADGTSTTNFDDHFEYNAFSFFVQDTIYVGEKLTVTAGVRVESVDIDAADRLVGGFRVDRSFTELLPALSASYLIRDFWSVFLNLQTSFRPPDVFKIELSTKPQSLSAELAETYEAGTRADLFGGGLFVDLTLFWIDFHDKLERDPQRDDVIFNIGEARHRGVEFEFEGKLGRIWESLEGVKVFGSYSFVDAEVRSGALAGNDLRHAPHNRVFLGASYEHPDGFWGRLDGWWIDDSFADEANTVQGTADGLLGRQPSYSVWNARVGYAREVFEGKGRLNLEVGVNNVFDESYFYRRPGKGILPGTDRSFYASISLSFRF
ncbi:MAG: TonB-dependent receptor family protein [Planctomycetota bacterium]